MYLNIYNYTKYLFGRNIEIFNNQTKWGYISWSNLFGTTAKGDLYGKKYELKLANLYPLNVRINSEDGSKEIAQLKFNIWHNRATLNINDKTKYLLKTKHFFISKFVWYSKGTEVMRIKNEFKGGFVESSVTNEDHNAIMLVSSLYVNNHLSSIIILLLIALAFILE